ncbi:MAG: YheE family protein [Bacillus sp. (in: Bacteria)]|nr:YheE family protein [Bacillus sp. (in: firmicutes)]
MLTHFNYKEIKNNMINQQWDFSFFYKQKKYKGSYFKDGTIQWDIQPNLPEERKFLETCIHDLMLFHVYEEH